MSNTTQNQAVVGLVGGAPAGAAERTIAAEVVTRTFTCGGWVPQLRWLGQPVAAGTKLYVVGVVDEQGGATTAPESLVVAEVIGFSVAYGKPVPQLRWLAESPTEGTKLYQKIVTEPAAPITSGADYKGHESLAEMLVTHLDNYRRALKFQRGHANDADDRAWFDHELAALLDIEKACRADIKAGHEAKATARQ